MSTHRLLLGLGLVLSAGFASAASLGDFREQTDIGHPARAGTAVFDEAKGTYTVGSSGANMWKNADEFHYVWKRIDSDFLLSAEIQFPAASTQGHRKACLVIRESLEAGARYADVAFHGDGLTSLQFRLDTNGPTAEVQANLPLFVEAASPPLSAAAAGTIPHRNVAIERRGNTVYLLLPDAKGKLSPTGCSVTVPFASHHLYVGLAVCAHDPGAFETAVFSHVTFGRPVRTVGEVHSSLEYVKVPSGDRRSVYASRDVIGAPIWSQDGAVLRCHRSGSAFDVDVAATSVLAVAAASHRFVGGGETPPLPQAWVYYHSERGGSSQIWRRHPGGSGEEQVTHDALNNYFPHPSPNGKWLAILSCPGNVAGIRMGQEVTLRLIPVRDNVVDLAHIRTVARIRGGPETMNLPSWSPDSSKFAYVRYPAPLP